MTANLGTIVERIERLKLLLAEAGFPQARVYESMSFPGFPAIEGTVPSPVAWRAYLLAGECLACFACWTSGRYENCLDASGIDDCGVDR